MIPLYTKKRKTPLSNGVFYWVKYLANLKGFQILHFSIQQKISKITTTFFEQDTVRA